jgi:quercetin dioxygenase-like cupin family protein
MTTLSFTAEADGELARMGVADMRLLLDGSASNGALAVAEFTGKAGTWTVPHLHRETDETFYVLDGTFTFTCDGEDLVATAGSLLHIPRGTTHVFTAETDGALLLLWTPGGLEQMFLELGRSSAVLTDPAARAAVARRYDSIPV